jgi:hypothetical protein
MADKPKQYRRPAIGFYTDQNGVVRPITTSGKGKGGQKPPSR